MCIFLIQKPMEMKHNPMHKGKVGTIKLLVVILLCVGYSALPMRCSGLRFLGMPSIKICYYWTSNKGQCVGPKHFSGSAA